MKQIYLLTFLVGLTSFGQDTWNDFTGKEKAFLYHQSRRVDILKNELFPLFEYKDSIPYINDTLPDYGYVEKQIVLDPSLLILHTAEVSRKSVGVVMDLSVRYSLWELEQVLQYRKSTAEADKPLLKKLEIFEKFVIEEMPQSALRTLTNGEYVLLKSIDQYYTPSLTVSDKLAAIINSGYSKSDQMLIVNAIMAAQEKYVARRSQEIFIQLGGLNKASYNYLSAVGDGNNWAEIKGGFNTPYTIGLADDKNMFKFEITEEENKKTKRIDLKVKDIVQRSFVTDNDLKTVVHVDVFGYHPERQTTIAIQKGANSYVLYGKNDHRLVSPDSSYGEGTTYWRLMYNLEHVHIANLKEDLYGKHGYEYQIDQYEQKIEKTKLQIKATEYRLDELRHTPEGKPKIKKKKIKKKNLGLSDQAGTGHPTSALSKLDKKKNIEQNRLIQLNNQLDGQKAILAKLKEEMEKAYERLVICETKLDYMRKNIGYTIMEFTVNGDVYLFKDGAMFNYRTQDFTFPPGDENESFQIYHISFGKEVFDDKIDENFARIQVSQSKVESEYSLERQVTFDKNLEISISDSIQIRELFRYLSEKKSKTNLHVYAGGIGEKIEGRVTASSNHITKEFNSDEYENEDIVYYFAQWNGQLNLNVTAYAGRMKPENFSKYTADYLKMKSKYPELNEIDFYSGILAQQAVNDWVKLLQELANKWIKDSSEKKAILSQLKKMKVKSVEISKVAGSIKVPEY